MSKTPSFPVVAALIVIIVGLGLMILLGNNNSTQATSETTNQNGTLALEESSWDFGDISMTDGFATHDVEFQNTSDQPVKVTSMYTSCMCTKVSLLRTDGSMAGPKGMMGHGGSPTVNETIEPGEQAILRVVFDPNAHGPSATGPIRRSVTLTTSSTSQPTVELSFSGNVIK